MSVYNTIKKVAEPYISIDILHGDKERPGMGQYLMNKVVQANPGKPIYSELARENGARFKLAFREYSASGESSREKLQTLLQKIPALRSVPGKVELKPIYNAEGEITEMGVIRHPDLSANTATIENVDQVVADPRFTKWMNSLKTRGDDYFEPSPTFEP